MRGWAMTTATATARKWLVWAPVLMVASLLYWTVALGLGGMSLMAVSALSGGQDVGGLGLDLSSTTGDTDTAEASPPRDGYEPIVVRLEESVEPEDVDDNAGCGLSGGASAPGGAGADADGTAGPVGHSGSTDY